MVGRGRGTAAQGREMNIQILGPVEIMSGGTPIPLRRRKQRLLLALLATRVNQLVPVSRIIGALWEEDIPLAVRNQIHVHVSAVRHALTASTGAPTALETRGTGYVLHSPPAVVDVEEFEDAAAAGERALAAGRLPEALASFRTALGIWRGTPLDGLGGRFAESETARLEERRLLVLERRLDTEFALGRHAGLVSELAGLLNPYPLHEGFRRRYMLALYRSGRAADALAAYREGRRLLNDELGIEPSVELRDVELAILRGVPAHQLVAEAVPAGHESASTATGWRPPARPRQLPHDVAHFKGRRAELARLDALCAPDRPRVTVVVTGPAGIGKTALCAHWAHRAAAEFPDGELYVDLRGSGPNPVAPAAALAHLLRALGMPPERIPSDVAQAAADYRSLLASTRMLVVLDDAATSAQVRPLLPGTPSCQAMVTARNPLADLVARDGAEPIRLDALSMSDARNLLSSIVGERRTAAEPAAVNDLVAICENRPIALRVVAVQLTERRDLDIAGFVAELLATDPKPGSDTRRTPRPSLRW